jgi:lambda family phage portal protein
MTSSNWLDKTIGIVAPRIALQRMRARAAMQLFNYDGATSGRRTSGWQAGTTDANAELGQSIYYLRNRSRELVRNNPYASKAISELVGNTVGTGIVPRAKTGSAKWDKVIDGEWPYFSDRVDPGGQYDFYGLQALMTRTTAESGEGLIRYRPRRDSDNFRIPLQLQVLEADFLDANRTMGLDDAGYIIQGVEFDPIGQRRAYWLYNFHPGAVALMNPRGGILSRWISADQVLHNYRILRPGQVRGVPWLSPVMMALRDLDDYRDAERIRKKIEACAAAMVTQPEGSGGIRMGAADANDVEIDHFEPGMILYGKPGQDIKFNQPHAVGGYREYLTTELQGIGAGVDVPYELLSNDLSNVNYSSYRAGMLSFRNTIEAFRWLTLIPCCCNPAWKRFIDIMAIQGKIPKPMYGVQWTAPKFESVDPAKDAQATKMRIRIGTTTWPEAVAENGYDPQSQLEEIAVWNQKLDDAEIVLDSDPRWVNDRGLAQPVDSTEETAGVKKAVAAPAAPKAKPAKVKNAALEAEVDTRMAALRANFERENPAPRTFLQRSYFQNQ